MNTNSRFCRWFLRDATATGPVAGFDPVLISLIRRSMPNLVAYDLAGVQPMNGPTGLIFAMRSRYGYLAPQAWTGDEAFYNEAIPPSPVATTLPTTDRHRAIPSLVWVLLLSLAPTLCPQPCWFCILRWLQRWSGYAYRLTLKHLDGTTTNAFNEMNFSIEKVTVTAKSRALKAEYSLELAQDLKAIHGLNAEGNSQTFSALRFLLRSTVKSSEPSTRLLSKVLYNTATAGVFDLDIDSNGRWSVEKFKGLLFQIERDANAIAQRTRRGKGNIIMTSADVASALTMAGVLDYTPALNANLNVDDTGNTFAGVLQGKYRVYIDPYSANLTAANAANGNQYYVVGYKGTSPYDAGLFYCPYVPLQMVRAVGENSFQPKINFKTRYGLVANPFAEGTNQGLGALHVNQNRYYEALQLRT